MKTVKILSVGNSFSQDAHAYLHQILLNVGIDSICYDLIVGGCPLDLHSEYMKSNKKEYILEINGIGAKERVNMEESALLYDWDFVTFQQASRKTGQPETFEPFLPELMSYFNEKVPSAKQYLHQTWAYEKNTGINWFQTYDFDQKKMYGAIIDTFKLYSDKYSLPLIRAGEVIQTLRSKKPFDIDQNGTAPTRDGFHLNIPYGRYAVGLTWANALCGVDPEDVTFVPEDADAEICELIRKTVKEVLQ